MPQAGNFGLEDRDLHCLQTRSELLPFRLRRRWNLGKQHPVSLVLHLAELRRSEGQSIRVGGFRLCGNDQQIAALRGVLKIFVRRWMAVVVLAQPPLKFAMQMIRLTLRHDGLR